MSLHVRYTCLTACMHALVRASKNRCMQVHVRMPLACKHLRVDVCVCHCVSLHVMACHVCVICVLPSPSPKPPHKSLPDTMANSRTCRYSRSQLLYLNLRMLLRGFPKRLASCSVFSRKPAVTNTVNHLGNHKLGSHKLAGYLETTKLAEHLETTN